MLDAWLGWARRSQIPAFVELYHRIKRHRAGIVASVTHGLSNGLTESVNTKLRLITRMAYGQEKSIGRPKWAGRPIGQEAGRAGGATASRTGPVDMALRFLHLVPVASDPPRAMLSNCQAASLRASASSRTAVTARFTRRRAASAVTPSSSPTSR